MRASRLGHKKSRFGCTRCKKRHVKCDEQRPCQNCVRHDAPCSLLLASRRVSGLTYSHGSQQTAPFTRSPSLTTPSDVETVQHDELLNATPVGTPGSSTTVKSTTDTAISSVKRLLDELQKEVQSFENGLNMSRSEPSQEKEVHLDKVSAQHHTSAEPMQSLQLLHHYCTSTYATLANSPETKHVWKLTIPQIAFKHEFLMNGLLAVSALHLAYLNPDLSKSYCTVSAHYQSLALDAFSSRVTDIDETNSDAYYLLAGLIFLMSTFSIAHFETDKLTPNEVAQSFILVQGIKNIRSVSYANMWISHGPLAEAILRPETEPTQSFDSQVGFVERLYNLSDTIRSVSLQSPDADDEIRESCLCAIDLLRKTHASAVHSEVGARRIWAWPFELPPSFPKLLAKGNPVALIILAHFVSLVREFEGQSWFVEGWSKNVQAMVEKSLDQPWRAWVDWPRQCVSGDLGLNVESRHSAS